MQTVIFSLSMLALFYLAFGENKEVETKQPTKTASECKIPAFAKAIAHEDKWLLHNGCPPRKSADEDTQQDAK
jgi:hypothetical protein